MSRNGEEAESQVQHRLALSERVETKRGQGVTSPPAKREQLHAIGYCNSTLLYRLAGNGTTLTWTSEEQPGTDSIFAGFPEQGWAL